MSAESDDRTPGVEWTAAEREAVALAAEDALLRMHGVVSSCDGRAEADLILDELAPFVAERERAAAAKALRDAAGLFNPVTGSPLSPGNIALRLHHVANRVEAGDGGSAMTGHEIPPYAGTDCSGCGKFGDECWNELQGDTCCIYCRDEETNGHHVEGVDRASNEANIGACDR